LAGFGSRGPKPSPIAFDEGAEFDPETQWLLERAAEHAALQQPYDPDDAYAYHQGALHVGEEKSGDFWSIEVLDVYKRFGPNQVLNGLTFGIPDGMITVILGPSGTGKSVLINHLIGLMYPDRGEVRVHGESVSEMRMRDLLELRKKFGILFQDGALFGSMSIYDNVAFPLRQHTDFSEAKIRQIVELRLDDVGLTRARDRMPGELSGGMKKRAGFARALVLEPQIVMFDEPDSGLDPVRTALLCSLIEQMHREHGGTYVVITHDIASMRRIGEYIAVLWKGRIVQSGDREEMLNSENPFIKQFLAGAEIGPLGME
jgi:phospholipid/cholesterol/gamma-HCH transport system ATP-binding protein